MSTPTLRLSPQQVAALAVFEVAIGFMNMTAQSLRAAAPPLALVCAKTADELAKAHAAFIAETQRTVSIAAPSEMAEAVRSIIQP